MKGFVLAAGFGTRLAPLTQTVPKPLFPVGHLPLIGYALRLLAHHGITDVIVNLHHLGKQLRDAVGDGSAYGVSVTYSEEPEILGTGGGLKKMHHALDDTFVVVNSDTILDVDLTAVLEAHRRRKALATMILRRDPDQGSYGQIEIDGDGKVRRILGHMSPSDEKNAKEVEARITPYMFTGVHVLEPGLLEYLPEGVETCIMRYGYMKAMNNDELIQGVVTNDYWVDAGTPKRYFDANVDVLTGKARVRYAGNLPPEREPRIWVAPTAEVAATAKLQAPVMIGDGVRIGDGAQVGPNTVLAAGSCVGRDVVIENSVVLDDARADEQAIGVVVGKKARVEVVKDA